MSALRLDHHLCFAFYSAAHAFNRVYRPMLDELGLTYPQYLVLVLLWENDRRSVGDLSARLLLPSSTLTPVLKRLEKLGLLTRARNDRDERVVDVTLTDVGRKLEERVVDLNCSIADAIGETDDDRELLRKAVVRIRSRLEKATIPT
jgi:DNA-binding MarR family transcriptional regulator